jgi:intracellular septation protein A
MPTAEGFQKRLRGTGMLNFDWLRGVSLLAAKWVFLALFGVSGLLVMMIPKEYIYEGVESPRWWHNLKLWALGVLTIIFTIYYTL